MKKTVYKLELHETIEVLTTGSSTFTITRVPGGWIYENYRLDHKQMTSVFVPFNNEFEK